MAEADAAIRKILDLTLEAETAGLKSFEYDKIRYYAHLQISHLANAMKNDEVAKLEMDRAISSFRRIAHPDAKKSTDELIRGLTELIEEVEKVTPPAWRNASKEILQEPKH